MKRILIPTALPLLLAAGILACVRQAASVPVPAPTLEPNAVPVSYRNVSLVAPPFYSNKVTGEELELREQMSPAESPPAYQRIIFQVSSEFYMGETDARPDSQVLVYPLADLVQAYPEAANAAARLQSLLKSGETPPDLPFWPLYSYRGAPDAPPHTFGRPVLAAQARYLDFKSGRGIRYVTLLEEDPPLAQRIHGLVYTFQGLTTDGMYYVAVIGPLSPDDRIEAARHLISLVESQPTDYTKIAEGLEGLAPDQFFLPLDQWDALVNSIEVR